MSTTRSITVGSGFAAGRPQGSHAAFSLIELLIVIMIIGIVAMTAVPRFASIIGRRRLIMAAQRVQQDVKQAQAKAIQTSSPYLVRFSEANCLYSITAGTRAAPGADYTTVRLGDEPYAVSTMDVSYTPTKTLVIDGYGVADQSGTVTLSYGRDVIVVTIDADGGVSVASTFDYR